MMGAGMDPMAGLGGASGPAEGTAGEGRSVFNGQFAQQNAMAIGDMRQFLAIVSGAMAGVLGITSWHGLVFFVVMHCSVGAAMLLVSMGNDLKKYTGKDSKLSFITDGAQATSLSFMLFWTLFYGLVYLF